MSINSVSHLTHWHKIKIFTNRTQPLQNINQVIKFYPGPYPDEAWNVDTERIYTFITNKNKFTHE